MRARYFQMAGFLLLTTSVILASCGGSSSNSAPAAATSLAMKGTSGNAVNMNGTWTNCVFKSGDNQYERNTFVLNGGSATVTTTVWAGATNTTCAQTTTPDAVMNFSATGTLGAEATAVWVDGTGISTPPSPITATAKATSVSLTINSATITPGSTAFVTAFNTSNMCGGGWVINVPKNVLTCTSVLPSTTETDYWVVDDSAAQLKWYQGSGGTAWQVEKSSPLLK
jgi:hypothetical protein